MYLNKQSVLPTQTLLFEPLVRGAVNVPGAGTLYASGDVRLLEAASVAIVGSRQASHAGRALAAAVACELVRRGIVVMSGLASGIDASAHQAAMSAGGRTVAVIGTSLDQVYPQRHASLQERIAREHLVVSPFASGTPTARWHFPARNRVMARLSRAMVLVEAGEMSGTRHQVQACLALGRPVLVHTSLLGERGVTWLARLHARGELVVFGSAPDAGRTLARVVAGA